MNLVEIFTLYIFYNIFLCSNAQMINKQTVLVGQLVKLKCGPVDKFYNFDMKFRWEKPPGNVIGFEPEMTLQNVDFKDGGIYTCIVTHTLNNRKQEKSVSTELLVEKRDSDPDSRVPPSRIDNPTISFQNINGDIIDLQETDYLYTSCDVDNWRKSDYRVEWIFNQRPIYGASNVLFKSSLDATKDTGYFICRIVHKDLPGRTFEKTLLVNIRNPEIIIKPLPEEDLKTGGRIYRKCEIKQSRFASNEPLQYSWTKNNHAEIANGNTLDITISDASVEGLYTCIVKLDKFNKRYTKDSSITIDKSSSTQTPEVNILTTPNSPILSKEFRLKCEVSPPPLPNINYRWSKDGLTVGYEQTLKISNFKRKDIGTYSCEILNAGGHRVQTRSQSSDSLLVNFQYSSMNKIELSEEGGQLISRVGDKKEMHCEIPSTSKIEGADVLWFFNNQPLHENHLRRYNIYKNDRKHVSILTLRRITLENEGQYICRFENLTKKINLIVLQGEPLLYISPEKVTRNEGESLEFHCRGNNIPDFSNHKIVWSYQNKDRTVNIPLLRKDPNWEITNNPDLPETSFIALPNAQVKDEGFYTCSTHNGMQQTAELTIERKDYKYGELDSIILTISPEIVRVRSGQSVSLECFSVSQRTRAPSGEPRFTLDSGRKIINDPRMVEENLGNSRVRLTIKDGFQTNDNKLKVECHAGPEVRVAMIYLENQCQPNYRRCLNGECQPSGKFCDGIKDCSDGSDEIQAICNKCDPLIRKCEYFRNKAPIKPSYLAHWKCDGENDCGNKFDEAKCSEEDFRCGNLQFTCRNGKKIPRAYQCDKVIDCPNQEDEMGCVLPQIIAFNGKKIKKVRKGEDIELKCEAFGNPKPFVLWRHNWGCLRDPSRMTVTSFLQSCKKVISTLKIKNFQPGDDGIYNCETLSNENRSFSEDYQLIMESI